jgi:heptosyltransferase I
VPRSLHAIERSRRLAAAALGYGMDDSSPDFGLAPPVDTGLADLPARYGILIPCASRPEKLWPEADWIAIGQHWQRQGMRPVILWGSPDELARAKWIAQACDGWVPPFLSVGQTASVLRGATQLVGLDTGFSHLGAALGVPSVGIYCDHEPGLAGIIGSGRTPVVSLGGKGQRPTLAQVMTALETVARP